MLYTHTAEPRKIELREEETGSRESAFDVDDSMINT